MRKSPFHEDKFQFSPYLWRQWTWLLCRTQTVRWLAPSSSVLSTSWNAHKKQKKAKTGNNDLGGITGICLNPTFSCRFNINLTVIHCVKIITQITEPQRLLPHFPQQEQTKWHFIKKQTHTLKPGSSRDVFICIYFRRMVWFTAKSLSPCRLPFYLLKTLMNLNYLRTNKSLSSGLCIASFLESPGLSSVSCLCCASHHFVTAGCCGSSALSQSGRTWEEERKKLTKAALPASVAEPQRKFSEVGIQALSFWREKMDGRVGGVGGVMSLFLLHLATALGAWR